MMSIGENIQHLRKKSGFTQKYLAEKVGVNEVTIRSYEAGKYNPKMNVLTKLCIALDCKITDLIDGDNKKYYRMFDNEKVAEELDYEHSHSYASSEEEYEALLKQHQKQGEDFLLSDYRKLNNIGQAEARKRVNELTEIPRYTKLDEPPQE